MYIYLRRVDLLASDRIRDGSREGGEGFHPRSSKSRILLRACVRGGLVGLRIDVGLQIRGWGLLVLMLMGPEWLR